MPNFEIDLDQIVYKREIKAKKSDKLNNINNFFLNLNNIKKEPNVKYKNNFKSINNNIKTDNNIINNINDFGRNNLRNILDSPIKLFNPLKKEANTRHADAIPESAIKKLYNSIVRIKVNNTEGTGFFMKIQLGLREMRC